MRIKANSVVRIVGSMFFCAFFIVVTACAASDPGGECGRKADGLYWFIPDGLRADPELFNIFRWAGEGKLPNIKKMMDNGCYGYSVPVFPSHTPVNFASLLTGAYPRTHGIADGPMHIEGRPLDRVAVAGFSSVAKKVPPIWVTMEKAGKKIFLLSIPGSTPPELDRGMTIRGRWSGWGADIYPLVFQSQNQDQRRSKQGRSARLFFFGPELTHYFSLQEASGWSPLLRSHSVPLEAEIEGWGARLFLCLYDSTDDKRVNYDRVVFSRDKKELLADLRQGEWSGWIPLQLNWNSLVFASEVKIKAIKLECGRDISGADVRLRFFYDNLNRFVASPAEISAEVFSAAGPMVDFADNYPAQLIYSPLDRETFLQEAGMSFDWHCKAAAFILSFYKPDVFIQDIYTPGQMLSSRWWLGAIDPESSRYRDFTASEKGTTLAEVLAMYKRVDDILGVYLAHAGKDTLIVLSSDHGMVALNRKVKLNNLFASHGLLKFSVDPDSGEPRVDWRHSRVIYLKMDNIYIHPDGLAGNWKRAKGREYDKLRKRVITMLEELRDDDGKKPLAAAVKWEDAEGILQLPADRVGDLVIANNPGFSWDEEMGNDLRVFADSQEAGYKQAVFPGATKALWTPFVIMGPGVRKNHEISRAISNIDQYPTILHLMGMKVPDFAEGTQIKEIYEQDN